jgi:hypothetical protein
MPYVWSLDAEAATPGLMSADDKGMLADRLQATASVLDLL